MGFESESKFIKKTEANAEQKAKEFNERTLSLNLQELSDEELLKLYREAHKLSLSEFGDDANYIQLNREKEEENKKDSVRVTKEKLELSEKIIATTRGGLNFNQKMIHTELFDMRDPSGKRYDKDTPQEG